MDITKEILANAQNGMEICKQTGKTCHIQMMDTDPRHINWIVERGNTYYCRSEKEEYVYWDRSCYGFTFSPELFNSYLPLQ